MSDSQKVLYIDDDVINVELFELNFSKKFPVISGFSGKEGLDLLASNNDIDVIISDMRMPGMNGLEFIREAHRKYSDKRYYLLTGYDLNDEIREALKTGQIRHCFSKPFNEQEITEAVRSGS